MSILKTPAFEIAEQVRSGKISALEVLDAHLACIDALNPTLNAVIEVDRERARAAARTHNRRGSLAGVPLTMTSSIDVAGLPNECGTQARAGFRAEVDAPLVARLRDAGAIILGVTNV